LLIDSLLKPIVESTYCLLVWQRGNRCWFFTLCDIQNVV